MKTRKYRLDEVYGMISFIIANPLEYRLIVELKRNHEEIWSDKTAHYTNDYYMFDLSDGFGTTIFEKFLVSACMFNKYYSCDASKLNCIAFIMQLVRNNKVKSIYIDVY